MQNKVFGPAEQSLEKCFFNRILSSGSFDIIVRFSLERGATHWVCVIGTSAREAHRYNDAR